MTKWPKEPWRWRAATNPLTPLQSASVRRGAKFGGAVDGGVKAPDSVGRRRRESARRIARRSSDGAIVPDGKQPNEERVRKLDRVLTSRAGSPEIHSPPTPFN